MPFRHSINPRLDNAGSGAPDLLALTLQERRGIGAPQGKRSNSAHSQTSFPVLNIDPSCAYRNRRLAVESVRTADRSSNQQRIGKPRDRGGGDHQNHAKLKPPQGEEGDDRDQ